MTLLQAPRGRALRVVSVSGGDSLRRRLLSLGFHRKDLLEVDSAGIFRGPLLVRNLTAGTSVALGRGVAQKVLVDIALDE